MRLLLIVLILGFGQIGLSKTGDFPFERSQQDNGSKLPIESFERADGSNNCDPTRYSELDDNRPKPPPHPTIDPREVIEFTPSLDGDVKELRQKIEDSTGEQITPEELVMIIQEVEKRNSN